MLLDLRVALITGGGGRIGRVIAATMLREGARVALCDTDAGRTDAALASLGAASGAAVAVCGDVAKPADVARMVDEAERALGPIDVLVNGAAVYPNCPLLEMDVHDWDRVYEVNVRGVMLTCQAVGRRMVARGAGGAIVNLSSGASRSARRGAAAYCGSKAALNMLTEVLAIELGPHGIRVNAVLPGLVMDDVVTADTAGLHDYYDAMLRATPLGRTGDASEIAEAVVFLASERSSWTTGALLDVSGGSHCGRTHVPYTRDIRAAAESR
jgi:NAD(P)-dependent dehydrogenase (short-subunit alcohol dehydrogenase family)